jgi:hypothetical protein
LYNSRALVASARAPGHKVAPPCRHRSCRADAPDRSCRAASPSPLRRAPAQTRIRAPERAGRCDRASACRSSAVSQACVSLIVRGVGRQRAPPTRVGQAVDAAGHLARCRTPAGAHRRQRARVAHTTGLSVSSRCCCCCWCAKCARERSRRSTTR